jgi:hypothetical protein
LLRAAVSTRAVFVSSLNSFWRFRPAPGPTFSGHLSDAYSHGDRPPAPEVLAARR